MPLLYTNFPHFQMKIYKKKKYFRWTLARTNKNGINSAFEGKFPQFKQKKVRETDFLCAEILNDYVINRLFNFTLK